jgi:hypothetical protein
MWRRPERCYLVITEKAVERLRTLVDPAELHIVARSGGKLLLTNGPVGP